MPKKLLINLIVVKKLFFAFVVLLLLVLSSLWIFKNVYSFLAITDRKEADILVLEGWISNESLQLAIQEFQQYPYQQMVIASTSLPIVFTQYAQGELVFNLPNQADIQPSQVKEITVIAFSSSADSVHPAFHVVANDSLIGEGTTSADLGTYSFNLSHFPEPLDNIAIQLTEDTSKIDPHDSLYVHSILLDNQLIPSWARSVIYRRDKRRRKNLVWTHLFSDSEVAKELLIKQIPDSLIIALNAPEVHLNRTYNSALAVRQWVGKNYTTFPSMNIFTEGAHARRSLMLYRLAFGKHTNIGIISSPNPNFNSKKWWKAEEGRRHILEQTLKYLYAKFLFYPSKKIIDAPSIKNH